MKLKNSQVEVGYLYLTTANQYRAVLAMKDDFIIYAPSLDGIPITDFFAQVLPFENMPFKKCQTTTFAKKAYQTFTFNGELAIKHRLNAFQIDQAIAQCNAKAAITMLLSQ